MTNSLLKFTAKEFFLILFSVLFIAIMIVALKELMGATKKVTLRNGTSLHECYAHMWVYQDAHIGNNRYHGIQTNKDLSICVSNSKDLDFLGDGWVMLRMMDGTVLFLRSENYFIKLKPIQDVKSKRQRRG